MTVWHRIISVVILTAALASLSACASSPTTKPAASPTELMIGTKPGATHLAAVYLAPRTGAVLSTADLNAHGDVAVALDQHGLESLATTRVAIWVDKNAVRQVNLRWLQHWAGRRYPLAVIGYGNLGYAFRSVLHVVAFRGPLALDVPGASKTPEKQRGFSVSMLGTGNNRGGSAGYLRAFDQTPTVDSVLFVTNSLLAGTPIP